MPMTIDLAARFEGLRVKRCDQVTNGTISEITRPSFWRRAACRSHEEQKRALLGELVRSRECRLAIDEDMSCEFGTAWKRDDANWSWLIPRDASVADFYSLLERSDWMLYSGCSLGQAEAVARALSEGRASKGAFASCTVLLAYADNDPWLLFQGGP